MASRNPRFPKREVDMAPSEKGRFTRRVPELGIAALRALRRCAFLACLVIICIFSYGLIWKVFGGFTNTCYKEMHPLTLESTAAASRNTPTTRFDSSSNQRITNIRFTSGSTIVNMSPTYMTEKIEFLPFLLL